MLNRIEAVKKAKEVGKNINFDEFENGKLRYNGTTYPCGCLSFNTVLSDGSIGLGQWSEKCSACFHNDNNLI